MLIISFALALLKAQVFLECAFISHAQILIGIPSNDVPRYSSLRHCLNYGMVTAYLNQL